MTDHLYRIPVHPVKSSNISAVGYDKDKSILAVKFSSGAVYHYAGVSEQAKDTLLNAESIGKHFGTVVKHQHQAEKMTGSCPACGAKHGYIGDVCTDCGTEAYAPDVRK